MVGIHRMPKAKAICKKRSAQQHREMAQGYDGPEPRRAVKRQQDTVDLEHLAASIAGFVGD
jgi:hypothetical protein